MARRIGAKKEKEKARRGIDPKEKARDGGITMELLARKEKMFRRPRRSQETSKACGNPLPDSAGVSRVAWGPTLAGGDCFDVRIDAGRRYRG